MMYIMLTLYIFCNAIESKKHGEFKVTYSSIMWPVKSTLCSTITIFYA